MSFLPQSLMHHRAKATSHASVTEGEVRYAPMKSLWFTGMLLGAVIGGMMTFTWPAFAVFVLLTGIVLLFGHSLGSHRKLIHNSFECPKWLEYILVYCGVQVGLAGPLGLLRQHELRDYAQRLPNCHDYLRHGRPLLVDAWWQLHVAASAACTNFVRYWWLGLRILGCLRASAGWCWRSLVDWIFRSQPRRNAC